MDAGARHSSGLSSTREPSSALSLLAAASSAMSAVAASPTIHGITLSMAAQTSVAAQTGAPAALGGADDVSLSGMSFAAAQHAVPLDRLDRNGQRGINSSRRSDSPSTYASAFHANAPSEAQAQSPSGSRAASVRMTATSDALAVASASPASGAGTKRARAGVAASVVEVKAANEARVAASTAAEAVAAAAAAAARLSTIRSRAPAAARVPQVTKLDPTGNQAVYLATLDTQQLREALLCVGAAHTIRSKPLAANRTCVMLRLADVTNLTEGYAVAVRDAFPVKYKLGSVELCAAHPVRDSATSQTSEAQPWHQDVSRHNTVTVAIALSNIDTADGPMEFEALPIGSDRVSFRATGPPGTVWMFQQMRQRHRGTINHGASDRRVLFLNFETVV